MALECAHCGTRCDDDAVRCPKCLRTTHLEAVAAGPPKRAFPARAVALVAALAVGAGAFAYLRVRSTPDAPRAPADVAPAAVDPASITTPELLAVVARLRAESDPTARARMAASEVHRRRAASMTDDDRAPPPPRSPDFVWRVLPSTQERVTELDLARLVASLLRASGDATAVVAERTASARADEPLDPSGVLGSYVVLSGEHLVEVAQGLLVGAASVRHRALSPSALAGAISAQAALELASSGEPGDRAVQYANAAVEAWSDSASALAARARVWMLVGASGGLPLAESDLRSAVAMRDDAALHVLLARVLLLRGDLVGAARAATRASSMAPAWGTSAVALLALRTVNEQLDAGAPDACALLRRARASWTDDAYALCGTGVSPDVRAASARRLFEQSHDPLRVAFAASVLGDDVGPALMAKVRPPDRREAAAWLSLLGRPELAARLLGLAPDAGR